MSNNQGYYQFKDEETNAENISPDMKISKAVNNHEKVEYDPLQIPPNWELARKHGLARKVGIKLNGDKIE